MHVTIRLDSPGADGAVTQVNAVEATVSSPDPADAVVVAAEGSNVVVQIDLGEGADVPAVPPDWTWEWLWTLDLSSPPDPDAIRAAIEAQLASGSWDWVWAISPTDAALPESQDSGATSGTETDSEGQHAGTWTWTWVWEVEGLEGWEWTWTWTTPPPCDCTWTWNWVWTWTGGDAAAAAPVSAAVADAGLEAGFEQANTVAAGAIAVASAEIEQAVEQSQDGTGGAQAQDAAQALLVEQLVHAGAAADQLEALNWASVAGGSLAQLNAAAAAAAASAESSSEQIVVQHQLGDASDQAQWAGQVIEVVQQADAGALAGQQAVSNWSQAWDSHVEQSNVTDAGATAAVTSEIRQAIAQDQAGAGSLQTQQAGQVAAVEQAHTAVASSTQAHASNSNLSSGGAFVQVNVVVGTASSTASSHGVQLIVQAAAGDGAVQHQEAWQVFAVLQGGVALADATQSHVSNVNVYLPAPSLETPGGSGNGQGPSAVSVPGDPPVALASEVGQPGAPEAGPPPAALAIESGIAGAPVLAGEYPGSAIAGHNQVSASETGARAPAARVVPASRKAVDADAEETTGSLPGAPPEPGALSGVSQGTSSSGPAATVPRLQLHAPELILRLPSPAVRRPAATGHARERPG
jgi:hypothetical protein